MKDNKIKKIVVDDESLADKVKREAAEEIDAEVMEAAKKELKDKLRQLKNAKRIVANLEREIQEIELKLEQDLG